ncbi:response regulator [bacterium]|nr:response regulator [bacterium]
MRVLFVDDDAMNRRVVHDMLKVAGVTVDEAPDGASGLAKIDAGDYALILMDLRMPGMDGLTAIKHIRERADAKAGLPIIVVTADTSLDIREDCMSKGADEVLMKPVAMKLLFQTMGALIARKSRKSAISA